MLLPCISRLRLFRLGLLRRKIIITLIVGISLFILLTFFPSVCVGRAKLRKSVVHFVQKAKYLQSVSHKTTVCDSCHVKQALSAKISEAHFVIFNFCSFRGVEFHWVLITFHFLAPFANTIHEICRFQ